MTTAEHNEPRLAVLIPFYGNPIGLEASLRSLARESVAHDVIVVDDGNKVRLAIPRGCHPRATVLRHERNRGITAALNTGLEYALKAGYEYIARLDAGDLAVLGRLKRQVSFLDRTPDCKLVGGNAVFADESGRTLFTFTPPCAPEIIRRTLHRRCCFLHPTVMFRADVFSEVGLYREKYPAAEDYDLFFRIAKSFPTANIPEVLVKYEVSHQSISSRRRRAQLTSKLRIVLAHFDPLLFESYRGVFEAIVALVLPRAATTSMHTLYAKLSRAFVNIIG